MYSKNIEYHGQVNAGFDRAAPDRKVDARLAQGNRNGHTFGNRH
jgi:hypothetical protein